MAEPHELAALLTEFGKSFTRWMRSVMHERAGTSPARARLLFALQCRGACMMSELSTELDVTPRNITKLVDALEDESLVARKAHPGDRRATLVHLTEAGTFAAKETVLANQVAHDDLYSKLTDEDRDHLARILGILIDELDQFGRNEPSS